MAIFLLACKEMATRVKKLLIRLVLLHFELRMSAGFANGTILMGIQW